MFTLYYDIRVSAGRLASFQCHFALWYVLIRGSACNGFTGYIFHRVNWVCLQYGDRNMGCHEFRDLIVPRVCEIRSFFEWIIFQVNEISSIIPTLWTYDRKYYSQLSLILMYILNVIIFTIFCGSVAHYNL